MTISAGNFEIYVSDPHPCWVQILYRNETIANIRHDEIIDLQFALERAKQEAIRKLGPQHRDEIL